MQRRARVSPYARRFLTSLVIALVVFVVIACVAMLGVRIPTLGATREPWFADPTVWMLVLAVTIVVGVVQRRRPRR